MIFQRYRYVLTRTDRQTSGTDTAIRTDISLRPDGRVHRQEQNGNWIVTTDSNVSLEAPVIVIAAGAEVLCQKAAAQRYRRI